MFPMLAAYSPYLWVLSFLTLIILDGQFKSWSPLLYNFLHPHVTSSLFLSKYFPQHPFLRHFKCLFYSQCDRQCWRSIGWKIEVSLYMNILRVLIKICGLGSSVGIATDYGLDGPGIKSRWGRNFLPIQTGLGAHPASCTMGTRSIPRVKCGRGMMLTTHPLLVPLVMKE
jgi:hypothetical protein